MSPSFLMTMQRYKYFSKLANILAAFFTSLTFIYCFTMIFTDINKKRQTFTSPPIEEDNTL